MRTIIAGSRDCTDPKILFKALNKCNWKPTVVIEGKARGADTLGSRWALANFIPRLSFPADWDKYGKSAGYRRNTEMISIGQAEALILLWDGKSRGSKHMLDLAKKAGLWICVYIY